MARYNVLSDQAARMNLRDAARNEAYEAAQACAAETELSKSVFDESDVRDRAEDAFTYAVDHTAEQEISWVNAAGEIEYAPDALVDDEEEGRERYVEGFVEGFLETIRSDVAASIERKLDIDDDDINALAGAIGVGGGSPTSRSLDGNAVAEALCARFGLDRSEPLGGQLWDKGILNEAEAVYLDDGD